MDRTKNLEYNGTHSSKSNPESEYNGKHSSKSNGQDKESEYNGTIILRFFVLSIAFTRMVPLYSRFFVLSIALTRMVHILVRAMDRTKNLS